MEDNLSAAKEQYVLPTGTAAGYRTANIAFTDRADTLIKSLASQSGRSSFGQVIGDALGFYAWAVKQHLSDLIIASIDEGSGKAVKVPNLQFEKTNTNTSLSLPAPEKCTKKLKIPFSTPSLKILDDLCIKTKREGRRQQVIMDALALYEWAAKQYSQELRVAAINQEGTPVRVASLNFKAT